MASEVPRLPFTVAIPPLIAKLKSEGRRISILVGNRMILGLVGKSGSRCAESCQEVKGALRCSGCILSRSARRCSLLTNSLNQASKKVRLVGIAVRTEFESKR